MSLDLTPFIRLNIVATLRQALRREAEAAPRAALERALRAARATQWDEALQTLGYAQRLAPSATYISLATGEIRLICGDPRAAEPLELVARRTDWPGAWWRLALARMLQANPVQAAAELHQTLARNAPPMDAGFRRLAGELVHITGARGWSGLDTRGRITLGLAAATLESRLDIRLDDSPVDIIYQTAPPTSANLLRYARFGNVWQHSWQQAASLTVQLDGLALIGSPIDVQRVTRSEGFVRAEAGGLRGWCWLPGERTRAPVITVVGRRNGERIERPAVEPDPAIGMFPDLAAPRRFSVPHAEIVALGGDVDVLGPYGKPLFGSPLNPLAEVASAMAAARTLARRFPVTGAAEPSDPASNEITIPVAPMGPPPIYATLTTPRAVLVAIPVYRGLKTTIACIDSVLAAQGANEQLLVIVDASPDEELVAQLQNRAAVGEFALDLLPVNKGFPATANIGLRNAAERAADVILLNSDTLVAPGWVAALRAAIHSDDSIGTATPLSNAATILSYPALGTVNPVPDLAETIEFARIARLANADAVVDLPTAHGFCFYIRRECLHDVGLFREDLFAQGYGEENDWCLRARHLGWRHAGVPGAFVGHAEGQSFGNAKWYLTARNLGILNRLHPGYDALIAAWQARDPLQPFRRAMDIVRWHDTQRARGSVLLVMHDRAGGVLRHVHERAQSHTRDGRRAIILRPAHDGAVAYCELSAFEENPYPNLRFSQPRELAELLALLRTCEVTHIEFHHFVGHAWPALLALTHLGVPYDVYVHDYAWYCARITLTRKNHSYCGEPALIECVGCIEEYGRNIDEDISPFDLFSRSRKFLRGARHVVGPSNDTARRIATRFGIKVASAGWQDDSAPLVLKPTAPAPDHKRRICLAGAIGYEKGYNIILECARIIARDKLPLEFTIVGYTCADAAMLDTGSVRITGRYDESEAVDLIREQQADFAFLSSLWPETWSYVLSQFWAAQLPVIAFDIGTQAERIRRRGGGFLMPLNMPVQRIIQTFLTFSAAPAG